MGIAITKAVIAQLGRYEQKKESQKKDFLHYLLNLQGVHWKIMTSKQLAAFSEEEIIKFRGMENHLSQN